MECSELESPEMLVIYCRMNDEETIIRVFNCFYELYFLDFCGIFRKWCVVNSTTDTVEEQLRTAFDFGIGLFYMRIRLFGWEDRGATVKCALLTFCNYQLLGLTKTLRKFKDSASRFDNPQLLNLIAEYNSEDVWESERAIFKKALGELDPECQDFIRWRKLKEITDEEMETKYSLEILNSRKATDKILRCLTRLKRIIKNR